MTASARAPRGRSRLDGARVAALIAVAAVLAPALAVVARAAVAGEAWSRLDPGRVGRLLTNTLLLAGMAGVIALAVGLAGAWATSRHRFRGRRLAIALLLSPLGVPPYLVAQYWIEISGPTGPLQSVLGGVFFGKLWAAAAVIGLCTSPLCFGVLRAALGRLDRRYEEAAATLGAGPGTRLVQVVLPLLRPALAAGFALVALYACSDFGAVSALGVQTFTREIFFELELNFDRGAARSATAVLSLVLLGVAAPFFALDRWGRGAARFGGGRPVDAKALSIGGQVAVWAGVAVVVVPTSGLVVVRTLSLMEPGRGRLWGKAFEALGTTLLWATTAATIAVVVALLIAWVARRRQMGALVPLGSVGFVLPGPVVALGALLLVTASAWSRAHLYGTAAVLIAAWVVRALPEALQALDAGLEQVPESFEEAARTLGRTPVRAVGAVTLPLLSRSLAAGWVFVFAAAMRELPAAMLLKPLGSRTLSHELWAYAQDSMYADMAPAALLLLLATAPATTLILLRAGRDS